jgi:hypothetical protein
MYVQIASVYLLCGAFAISFLSQNNLSSIQRYWNAMIVDFLCTFSLKGRWNSGSEIEVMAMIMIMVLIAVLAKPDTPSHIGPWC